MRVVLAGGNRAALHVLRTCLDIVEHDAVLAITRPATDDTAWHDSLYDAAVAAGVTTIDPENVNDPDVVATIAAFEPTVFLSVYYHQLFREPLLGAIECPILNFHPSLLPRHRGTAPVIWAIAEGDATTGLTVHEIDRGIDTGDVVLQWPIPIHPNDTGYTLHLKLAELVRAAAAELLHRLRSGQGLPTTTAQRGEVSMHTSRDPRLNHLDWSWPADRICNVIRALAPPLPGAHILVGDQRLVIAAAEKAQSEPHLSHPPGYVDGPSGGPLRIWAADGPVEILTASVDGREVLGPDLWHAVPLGEGVVVG